MPLSYHAGHRQTESFGTVASLRSLVCIVFAKFGSSMSGSLLLLLYFEIVQSFPLSFQTYGLRIQEEAKPLRLRVRLLGSAGLQLEALLGLPKASLLIS